MNVLSCQAYRVCTLPLPLLISSFRSRLKDIRQHSIFPPCRTSTKKRICFPSVLKVCARTLQGTRSLSLTCCQIPCSDVSCNCQTSASQHKPVSLLPSPSLRERTIACLPYCLNITPKVICIRASPFVPASSAIQRYAKYLNYPNIIAVFSYLFFPLF